MPNKNHQSVSKKTSPSPPPPLDSPSPSPNLAALLQENQVLKEQVARTLADYQNLLRRQKEDQAKVVEYARITVFASLIQPLEHLSLAAASLKDQGLDMVLKQFWSELEAQGLREVKPEGEKFNPETMEAVEKVGEGEKVIAVLSPGYTLGDKLIQVAKVKVG
jgi:molecular chaperone GrpE